MGARSYKILPFLLFSPRPLTLKDLMARTGTGSFHSMQDSMYYCFLRYNICRTDAPPDKAGKVELFLDSLVWLNDDMSTWKIEEMKRDMRESLRISRGEI